MRFTLLIVEHIVIGIQTLTWVVLLVAYDEAGSLFPFEIMRNDPNIGASMLVGIVLLSYVYAVGMVADKVFHKATQALMTPRTMNLWNYKWWILDKKQDWHHWKESKKDVANRIFSTEDHLLGEIGQADRLYRRRGRIRIFRALLWNTIPTTFAVYLYERSPWVLWTAVVFFAVTVWALFDVHKEYLDTIRIENERRSDE